MIDQNQYHPGNCYLSNVKESVISQVLSEMDTVEQFADNNTLVQICKNSCRRETIVVKAGQHNILVNSQRLRSMIRLIFSKKGITPQRLCSDQRSVRQLEIPG
jgi:hypothetical protein